MMTEHRDMFIEFLTHSPFGKETRKQYLNEYDRVHELIQVGDPLAKQKQALFLSKFPSFINKYEEKFKSKKSKKTQIDIVIICALKNPEANEVIKILNNQETAYTASGYNYVIGYLGTELKVAVFSLNQMGPVDAASITTAALIEFAPKYLAMTGVCGGRASRNIHIGDVLVVNKALTYQTGEYRKNKFFYEPRVALPSEHLINLVMQNEKILKNHIVEHATTDTLANMSVIVGSMLCGDAIINDPDMIENISNQLDRRTIGVDMESFGVIRACNLFGSSGMHCIVAKGVMDICEQRENSRDKVAAAFASASFVVEILKMALTEINPVI